MTDPQNVGRIAVDALLLLFPAASIYFGLVLARGRSGAAVIRGPMRKEARTDR